MHCLRQAIDTIADDFAPKKTSLEILEKTRSATTGFCLAGEIFHLRIPWWWASASVSAGVAMARNVQDVQAQKEGRRSRCVGLQDGRYE